MTDKTLADAWAEDAWAEDAWSQMLQVANGGFITAKGASDAVTTEPTLIRSVHSDLTWLLPGLRKWFSCPACPVHDSTFPPGELFGVVTHLNDLHRWSRERIADWLETLDVDLTFPTAPPPRQPETRYASKVVGADAGWDAEVFGAASAGKSYGLKHLAFTYIGSSPDAFTAAFDHCQFKFEAWTTWTKTWIKTSSAAGDASSNWKVLLDECAATPPVPDVDSELPAWARNLAVHVPTTPELPAWDTLRDTAPDLPPEPEARGEWRPRRPERQPHLHDPASYVELKEKRRDRRRHHGA